MEESFARVETKYLLSCSQAAAVERGLMRIGFGKMVFGSPKVQSLYYDTADHDLIRVHRGGDRPFRGDNGVKDPSVAHGG